MEWQTWLSFLEVWPWVKVKVNYNLLFDWSKSRPRCRLQMAHRISLTVAMTTEDNGLLIESAPQLPSNEIYIITNSSSFEMAVIWTITTQLEGRGRSFILMSPDSTSGKMPTQIILFVLFLDWLSCFYSFLHAIIEICSKVNVIQQQSKVVQMKDVQMCPLKGGLRRPGRTGTFRCYIH